MNQITRNTALFILLQVQVTASAGDVKIQLRGDKQGTHVIEEFPGCIRIGSSVDLVRLSEIETLPESFFQINAQGYIPNYQPGAPELPVRNYLVEYPLGSVPRIRIISWQEDIIHLTDYGINDRLKPSHLSMSKALRPDSLKLVVDEAAYMNVGKDIDQAVSFSHVGSSRGTGIGMITISPFLYDQQASELIVLNDLVFEVTWPVEAEKDYKSGRSLVQSGLFDRSLSRLLYSSAPVTIPVGDQKPVKYVILSDTMFRDCLQPFVEWKTLQGYNVVELYKGTDNVGVTSQELKDTLKSMYVNASPEDPAPLFLLIAGDIQHIPASEGSSQLTDLYYAEYDGDGDYLPELFYGRFSASDTSEIKTLVEKSLQHEKYNFPDPGFLSRSVLIAGVDGTYASTWGNGQMNYENRYYFNDDHNNEVHKFLYPASGGMADSIKKIISSGVSFVNYTGHGFPNRWASPELSTADIPMLTNLDRYPVMIGNACSTAPFNEPECFAEALVRADSGGALAYIGSTNETFWDEDYFWSVGTGTFTADPTYQETSLGAFDRLFHENGEPIEEWYPALGQILYAGNLAVLAGNISRAKYYWEIYHLFGDPSLKAFYSLPDPMPAEHPSYVHDNSGLLAIRTEPYVYGGLTAGGVLLDGGFANGSGTLELDISQAPGGYDTLLLTLTGEKKQPHFAEVMILPDSVPYIEMTALSLNDSLGDNDMEADYGETISISLNLVNRGTKPSGTFELKLICRDPFLEIPDSLESGGPLDPFEEISIAEAFSIRIADSVSDLHSSAFTMSIEQGGETIDQYIDIPLHAPVLRIDGYSVDDRRNGNGNGRLDPGERARLEISIENQGSAASMAVFTSLTSLPGSLEISDTLFDTGIIPDSSMILTEFYIEADTSVSIGTRIRLPVSLGPLPYKVYDTLMIPVGITFDDFETGDLRLLPWQNDSLIPWKTDGLERYEGSFSIRSGPCTDYDTSRLEINLASKDDDSISFYYKVSSESGYDYFRFFMDGEQVETRSGQLAWNRFVHPVPAGEHTFGWMYTKDQSLAHGADAAWVDFVQFPYGAFSQSNAGLIAVLSPLPGQPFPISDSLKVRVRNLGDGPLDSIPLGYILNDALIWKDTLFSSLQPLDSADFTFNTLLNMVPGLRYELKIFTSLQDDGFRINDTLQLVYSNEDLTDAALTGFASPVKETADFLDTTFVSVWLRNAGSMHIDETVLMLYINKSLYSADTILLDLPQGDSTLVSFKDTFRFFHPGQYFIEAAVHLPFDLFHENDSISTLVTVDTVKDASLAAIVLPRVSDTVFTSSETVTISIHNEGNYLLTGLPLTLIADGEVTPEETVNDTIHPDDSIQYTFRSTADFSAWGYHDLVVYTAYPGDSLHRNDTLHAQFEFRQPYTSIMEGTAAELMRIYPNPSPGSFNIMLADAVPGEIRMDIYNTLGEHLKSLSAQHQGGDFQTEVDLADFPKGIYLLQIRSGSKNFPGRLIKLPNTR